jgi:hypothetical protein
MFVNSQWVVTDYGIEAIGQSPLYQIESRRLVETTRRGAETYYNWPLHLAEKSWVEIELFIDAYAMALAEHAGKYRSMINPKMLDRTFALARHIARPAL